MLNTILSDKIAHAEIPRYLLKKLFVTAFIHVFRSGFVSLFYLHFFIREYLMSEKRGIWDKAFTPSAKTLQVLFFFCFPFKHFYVPA